MGGATHSALSVIEEIKKRGNTVIVVCPQIGGYLKKRLDALNIPCYDVHFGFKSYPGGNLSPIKWCYALISSLWVNKTAARIIAGIIRKETVDIVHTNVGPVVCGYEACRKLGIPHVWHIREYGDRDFNIKMFPSKTRFRKWLLKSYVISITNDLVEYNNLKGFPNVHVIYNGVRRSDDLLFIENKEKYFLCASRVSPEKGFEQVIRVFSQFHALYPDYILKIIGLEDKKYKAKLIKLADSLSALQWIEFDGYQENVSEYMARAQALLVASPNEGFGRMTAEAAFAGCLVIGKNTAGTKEILDLIGGFPFISDEEMLSSMIQVINLRSDEKEIIMRNSQEKAINYFSEEKYVERVIELYESILSASS